MWCAAFPSDGLLRDMSVQLAASIRENTILGHQTLVLMIG